MNRQPFDFEKEQPPVVTQKMLQEQLKRRTLKRQILILKIASILIAVCFALFSFFIVSDSRIAACISIVLLFVYLSGSFLLSVLFFSGRTMAAGVKRPKQNIP
ncbi:MAG: hypothetical protein ACI4GY_05230 [Acutalibacteraceae bacterium]